MTIFSHNDVTYGEFIVAVQMFSTGILRSISSDSFNFSRNKTSAISRIRTKSSHGVTRPLLVRAKIKLLVSLSADFMFCSKDSNSSLFLTLLLAQVAWSVDTTHPAKYERGPRSSELIFFHCC